MDIIGTILSADTIHTLVLLVAIFATYVLQKAQTQKEIHGLEGRMHGLEGGMHGLESRLEGRMHDLENSLEGRMHGLENKMRDLRDDLRAEIRAGDEALRTEMREQFTTFHHLLKENDFAHLNRTIKALTFTLVKDKVIDSEDKQYVDSHLDKERGE
jgi:hypothetical protein